MRTQAQAGSALGPLAGGEIQRLLGRDERGESVPVLALPDASNTQRAEQAQPELFHAVFECPRIRRNPDGNSVFSATFILNRRPELTAPFIDPSTVEMAVLGLELELRPSDAVLRSLSQHSDHEYVALFPRNTNYRLVFEDRVVAECQITSFSSSAALEANLDKSPAQALLASIRGDESPLETHADLEYREASAPQSPTEFEMDLANVYDYLAGNADEQKRLTEADLRNYLALMLDSGIVRADPPLTRVWEQLVVAAGMILSQFLRAATYTLEKLPDNPTELGSTFRLRRRPTPGTIIRFDNRMSLAGSSRVLRLRGVLHALLSESLAGEDLDPYVHFIGPDGSAIPRRVKSNTRAISVSGRASFAAIGEGLTTVTHALRPQAATVMPAHTLMVSGLVHQAAIDRWTLNNILIAEDGTKVESLPIVDNPESPIWRDRRDAAKHWYAPVMQPVIPHPTDLATDSAFLFQFETKGHDQSGQPGLEATIRCTARFVMSEATRAAWEGQGKPHIEAVPMNNLSATLNVPFRDEGGRTRTESFRAAEVHRDGDLIVATFQLLDSWARLTYGALSTEGYQSDPARLSVAYVFDAYIPIQRLPFEIAWGGKIARIPIAATPEEVSLLRDHIHVDAVSGTIRFRGGELRMMLPNHETVRKPKKRNGTRALIAPASTESAAALTRKPPGPGSVTVALPPAVPIGAMIERPAAAALSTVPMLPPIRPELTTEVIEQVRRQAYAKRSEGRSLSEPILVPCNTYGAFYVERRDGQDRAIGCQEAYKLGQTNPKAYERLELSAFPDAPFRVYRSLQMPGRFLIVPEAYRIGRFEPSEGEKAYRPTILLYSAIDPENIMNSRCVLLATLIADIPPYWREQLVQELRTHHPNPTLELPTELPVTATVEWSVPETGGSGPFRVDINETRAWDGFQVSIITDPIGVQQLQEILKRMGVQGFVRFALSDGTSVDATINVDLKRIVGPVEAGPIEVSQRDGTVHLTNRVGVAADVTELLAVLPDGSVQRVPVDRRIEPGQEQSVPLSSEATKLLPAYTLVPTAVNLDEVRSFIEDISVNAVFINLIDMPSRHLTSLRVTARIQGVEGERTCDLNETTPVTSAEFLLPLTHYLSDPVLEFKVTRQLDDGTTKDSSLRSWKLSSQGSVIGLVWEIIS